MKNIFQRILRINIRISFKCWTKKRHLSEASCPEMPRGWSSFQLSALSQSPCHRPNHALKERIQIHYVALYFTGEFSFLTLKCHLSFGFTDPREKHSPTLDNHNGGTLPRPGMFVMFCSVCHSCSGTRGTWCSMKDQLNDAGTQVLCP